MNNNTQCWQTTLVTLGTLVFVGVFSAMAFSQEGLELKEIKRVSATPQATSLTLQRIDKGAAIIRARFPSAKPGGNVAIDLGGRRVVFSDSGEGADNEPQDGEFAVKTAFDFSVFGEANKILAEATEKQTTRLLFSPLSRQVVGEQRLLREGEAVLVSNSSGKLQSDTVLPFSPENIRIGQSITLPTTGLSLGVPSVITFKAPASIPRSLMITATSVVQDPDRTWACPTGSSAPVGDPTGEWTFWQLMENMANGTASTSDFIKKLFNHWNSNQVINNHLVGARSHVYQAIIKQWEIRSGGVGASLLPEESPFRLLGIVLRADLRGNGTVYSGGDAGEGRFVFSLHDGNCNSMPKTLILEYKVPIAGCANVRGWAQDWKALASSGAYNDDLAALTQVFADAGANPRGPNQSAISQLRTNEFLAGSPLWELREFVLPDNGGFLMETTVKQEPDIDHNNSVLLAKFVNANWPDLVGPPAGQHEITPIHLSTPFLAGSAPAPALWNVPNALLTVPTTPSPISPAPATIRDDALFQLGLNTCGGCHTVETGTGFAHLHYNTPPGVPAILSGFLTGTSLPDPRNGAIPRNFNDLARRANDLDDLASMACPTIGVFPIGNLVLHKLTLPSPLMATH